MYFVCRKIEKNMAESIPPFILFSSLLVMFISLGVTLLMIEKPLHKIQKLINKES